MKNIGVFEIRCYRKILKIKWTDKVINSEKLNGIGTSKKIKKAVAKRKVEIIGHNP